MEAYDRDARIARLTEGYNRLFDASRPQWAYKGIAPAIPYIGRTYGQLGLNVLVYASAENLASDQNYRNWIKGRIREEQLLRSYLSLDADPGSTDISIEPIKNGSLLKAARHALHMMRPESKFSLDAPASFLDEIAVANPGKFSVEPDSEGTGANKRKNLDYAGSVEGISK